jgi:hypothetical protein
MSSEMLDYLNGRILLVVAAWVCSLRILSASSLVRLQQMLRSSYSFANFGYGICQKNPPLARLEYVGHRLDRSEFINDSKALASSAFVSVFSFNIHKLMASMLAECWT